MIENTNYQNIEIKDIKPANKKYSYVVLIILVIEFVSYIKAYIHLAPSVDKLKNIVGGVETIGFTILMLVVTGVLLIVQTYALLVKKSFLNKAMLWLTVLSLFVFLYSLTQQFYLGCSLGGGC